jgi:hypothetical protein
MSMQTPEVLDYDGQRLPMATDVLEPYLETNSIDTAFLHRHTALERGYVGVWAILDDAFYLTELLGEFPDRTAARVTEMFFPGRGLPLLADWFSGTLRCPQGRRLQTRLLGWESVYERDLLIEIERGKVMDIVVHHNGCFVQVPCDETDIPDFLRRA